MAFPWERCCRDCNAVWDVQYADDDSVVGETDRLCPECGSDAVELLADAQELAALFADEP